MNDTKNEAVLQKKRPIKSLLNVHFVKTFSKTFLALFRPAKRQFFSIIHLSLFCGCCIAAAVFMNLPASAVVREAVSYELLNY